MKFIEIAEGELGVEEIVGDKDNPRILEYHSTTTLKATHDEVSWCSSFVNWVVKKAGYEGTNSAAARSWLKWGKPIETPEVGCIVVLKRGLPPSGHVCFYVEDFNDKIKCLGGNQSNKVKYSFYPKSDVLSYRVPV